jgi:menaquinone-dependent protoporphyrinogen oxidase
MKMNTKILVTYASQAGSTRGIAEAIAKTLTEKGLPVDTIAMKEVKSLQPYDTVVAGSAVHTGKWLAEALQFLKVYRHELSRKRVFAFHVGMALTMRSMQGEDHSDCLHPIRRSARIMDEQGFAGAVDFNRLPLIPDRLVVKGIVASGMWQAGDHRDWQAVRRWAEKIAAFCLTSGEWMDADAHTHIHTTTQSC